MMACSGVFWCCLLLSLIVVDHRVTLLLVRVVGVDGVLGIRPFVRVRSSSVVVVCCCCRVTRAVATRLPLHVHV